jgi:hypothetical protein
VKRQQLSKIKLLHSWSDKKQSHIHLMGIAINLSFSFLFHWHILDEHEHTMMYVSMHQSAFIRCHSCATIICFVFAISINYKHTCIFKMYKKNNELNDIKVHFFFLLNSLFDVK